MVKRNNILPKAVFGRILEHAGARRVSQGSMDTFTDIMTEIAEEISKDAIKFAKHSGRITVTAEDIKLAVK